MNETQIVRSQDEIVAQIEAVRKEDVFGWQTGDLVVYLDFDHAKPYLKDEVTATSWSEDQKTCNRETVLAEITDYMPFAWDKANNCRGISASRSIEHMEAWTWLLNDGTFEKMEAVEYEHYGKEKLIAVCESLGLDWKQWDDGIRTNTDC